MVFNFVIIVNDFWIQSIISLKVDAKESKGFYKWYRKFNLLK